MSIPARLVRSVRVAVVALAALLVVLATLIGWQQAAHAAPPSRPPAARPVKYYIVDTQFNGQPEFLFEIAVRFLGTGNRAPEIFNLNKGRLEPDGLRVERPEVIKPGWVLQLPADAKGDGVRIGPLPLIVPSSHNAAPGAQPGAARSGPAQSSTPRASSKLSGMALALWGLLGVIVLALTAAAVWAWRTGRLPLPNRPRRRRTVTTAPPDSSAAWVVDRSLRVLATACAQQNRSLPGVYAVVVGGEQIRLRLSAPDELPPTGWSVEDEGRTWVATLRGLQYAPMDDGRPDPYPHLVTLGNTGDGRVLLNLVEARGLIAIKGTAAMQRRMADAWTRELATNPWSREITVLRAGFGTADVDAHPPGTLSVPGVEQLWDNLAEGGNGVVLVAHAPGGRDLQRLNELAAQAKPAWAVVVLGGPKDARWQLAVQPDGWLETGFLPDPVRTGLALDQPRPATV